jgi:type VI secretion system protein ImpF
LERQLGACQRRIAELEANLNAIKDQDTPDKADHEQATTIAEAIRKQHERYDKLRNERRTMFSLDRQLESVKENLNALLNCTNLAARDNLDAHPHIARSVLNYGLPDLVGKVVAGLRVRDLENIFVQAIQNFEPRIRRDTIKVRAVSSKFDDNPIVFEIEGELCNTSIPLHLFLRTQVDLTNGSVKLDDLNG